jgi:hypothetical protein
VSAYGDLLWSRDEFDPDGPLVLKRVLRRFVRTASIWHLGVSGQVLRTTGEHPFWVENRGAWVAVNELHVGDVLRTRCGLLLTVESVEDTGKWERVYNWEIEEYHTYFVSSSDDALSIWAHNYAPPMSAKLKDETAVRYAESVKQGHVMDWGNLTPKQQRAVREHAVAQSYVDENFLHGNSLNTNAKARGYTLRDRDTGEILKYGETTLPGTSRYSQPYLDANNADMFPEVSGSKAEMHAWQNRQILDYVKKYGRRPLLNKSNY